MSDLFSDSESFEADFTAPEHDEEMGEADFQQDPLNALPEAVVSAAAETPESEEQNGSTGVCPHL